MCLSFPLCQKDFTKLQDHIKIVNAVRISNHIVSFDGDYFDFLQDELQTLGNNIREKSEEKLLKIPLCFNLLAASLKKIAFGLLPFNIYCHWFILSKR